MDAEKLKADLEAAGIGNTEPGAIALLLSLVAEGKSAASAPPIAEPVAEPVHASGDLGATVAAYVRQQAALQDIGFLRVLADDALLAAVRATLSQEEQAQ